MNDGAYQFVQGFLSEDSGKEEEAEHEKDGEKLQDSREEPGRLGLCLRGALALLVLVLVGRGSRLRPLLGLGPESSCKTSVRE